MGRPAGILIGLILLAAAGESHSDHREDRKQGSKPQAEHGQSQLRPLMPADRA